MLAAFHNDGNVDQRYLQCFAVALRNKNHEEALTLYNLAIQERAKITDQVWASFGFAARNINKPLLGISRIVVAAKRLSNSSFGHWAISDMKQKGNGQIPARATYREAMRRSDVLNYIG